MKSFALFLILSPYLCAQDVGLEGTMIDAITRHPLSGVHVMTQGPESYDTVSGKDGHFFFVVIRRGKDALWARHNGFFRVEKLRTQFALRAGERESDLTVEMTREAVITGRAVDDYCDPALPRGSNRRGQQGSY